MMTSPVCHFRVMSSPYYCIQDSATMSCFCCFLVRTVDQPTNQSNKSMDQLNWINHTNFEEIQNSNNQWIDQSINQSINQPAINESIINHIRQTYTGEKTSLHFLQTTWALCVLSCWYSWAGSFSSFCKMPRDWASKRRFWALDFVWFPHWRASCKKQPGTPLSQGTTFRSFAMAFVTPEGNCLGIEEDAGIEEDWDALSTSTRRRFTQALSLLSGFWRISALESWAKEWCNLQTTLVSVRVWPKWHHILIQTWIAPTIPFINKRCKRIPYRPNRQSNLSLLHTNARHEVTRPLLPREPLWPEAFTPNLSSMFH